MGKAEKSKETWWECWKRIVRRWSNRKRKPLIWFDEKLKASHCLNVVERLGHLAIIVAVIMFFAERDERQKAKHYQAWQVVNSAQGQTGSGGRIDALQDLNGDGISLAGVDISNATLRGINLEHANLRHANLSDAHLYEASLSMTNLCEAEMSRVFLYEADLSEADISDANLTGADLTLANLTKTDLTDIKNWQQIWRIEPANIWGVKNPPEGFIEWARERGAVSIESDEEWKKPIRKKIEEKKQQGARNSGGKQ